MSGPRLGSRSGRGAGLGRPLPGRAAVTQPPPHHTHPSPGFPQRLGRRAGTAAGPGRPGRPRGSCGDAVGAGRRGMGREARCGPAPSGAMSTPRGDPNPGVAAVVAAAARARLGNAEEACAEART